MPIEDILDKFAEEDRQGQKKQLSDSALVAHNVIPDKHAHNIKQAKKQGIHPAMATPATKEVDENDLKALMSDFHGLMDKSPKTANFYTNQNHAKIAHDDHPVLSALESVLNPFKAAGARVAQGYESATAATLEKLDVGADIMADITGTKRGVGFKPGIKSAREGEEYWKRVAERSGSTGLPAKVYSGIGAAPIGVGEFVAGPGYAGVMGAAEGYKKGGTKGAVEGALIESIKRYGLGKVFSGIEKSGLSPTMKTLTMAGTMGAQTGLEGGSVQDIVASTLTGAILMPPGARSRGETIRAELVKKGVDPKIAEEIKTRVEGLASQQNTKQIKQVVDTAKKSKLKGRDKETFKTFTKSASEKTKPVSMPVDKFDAFMEEKGLKLEDVFDDPSHYYEAKFEGRNVDIPLSDLAGVAEHVTPEHINDMSHDGIPSQNEIKAMEGEKPLDTEQGKAPEETQATKPRPEVNVKEEYSYQGTRQANLMGPRDVQLVAKDAKGQDVGRIWYTKEADGISIRKIETDKKAQRKGIATELMRQATEKDGPRIGSTDQTPEGKAFIESLQKRSPELFKQETLKPAVETPEGIKTGEEGERHTDIVPGAPEESRGFQTPEGEFIDREQGADWLEGNRPDIFENLPEDQKAELHSEGLWEAQGVEPSPSESVDWQSLSEELEGKQYIERGKGKKNWSVSDFREHLKEFYPTVAELPYPKSQVLKALEKMAQGKEGKLTEAQKHILSAFDSDLQRRQDRFIDKFGDFGEAFKDTPFADEYMTLYAGINPLEGVRAVMNLAGDIRDSKVGRQVEKLMTPGLDAARNVKKGALSLVLPTAKSPEHLAAGELLGAKLGKMHRNQESAAADLKAFERQFDKMGVYNENIPLDQNAGIKFMSDMSQGRQMTPKLQAMADHINSLFENRLKQLEEANAPLSKVRENYFPGMWTNASRKAFNRAMGGAVERGIGGGRDIADWTPQEKAFVRDRVRQLLAENEGTDKSALAYITRSPFKGRESFRKGKVFDDIMTGVEFGLEPLSPNPIEVVKLKLAEMDRSIMAHDALKDWRAQGDEKFLPIGQQVPEGWKQVDDKYGTVYGPRDMAGEDVYIGLPILGHRIVKEPVADVLNNYLSSSMYNNKYFGTLYKGYMGLANALNQSQLGVGSFFHAGFTASEVTISAGANTLKDMYGVLNGTRTLPQFLKSAAKIPAAMFKTPIEGDAILKEWRNPGSSLDPRIQNIAKAAELAGGGFKLEQGLRTDVTTKMIQDWYSEKKIQAAVKSPIAAVELMAKPIMDYLVPRQKAGVFGHLADRIIEQNPGKTLEQLTPQFRQAWNRVDARLGQVRYDRLFMNNVAKNTIQALIRAPGWSGGTITEIGGSAKDAATFVKEWSDTGKAPAELPDRIAYTIALMAGVSAVNGLLTYAFTGEKPKDVDFWAFRTGSTDMYGRPERFVLPTYQKDIFAYVQDPEKTLLAKTHPVISLLSDIAKNRDYYGVTIANEDDNFAMRLFERGQYAIKQFVPFWMRGVQQETERGGGLWETLQSHPEKIFAPQIGIMPATSAYTLSPAEKLINKFIGEQIPEGGRTKEVADISKARREIVRAFRQGATVDTLPPKLQEKFEKLTERQQANIGRDAELTPLQLSFKHLQDQNMQKSMKVWRKATDDEREELRDLYETRINKYLMNHDLSDDEMQKFNEAIENAEARK